jgi:hypothetical protein
LSSPVGGFPGDVGTARERRFHGALPRSFISGIESEGRKMSAVRMPRSFDHQAPFHLSPLHELHGEPFPELFYHGDHEEIAMQSASRLVAFWRIGLPWAKKRI